MCAMTKVMCWASSGLGTTTITYQIRTFFEHMLLLLRGHAVQGMSWGASCSCPGHLEIGNWAKPS